MHCGNEAPYFNIFILRALAACKLPTFLTDTGGGLNKQATEQQDGFAMHVLHHVGGFGS